MLAYYFLIFNRLTLTTTGSLISMRVNFEELVSLPQMTFLQTIGLKVLLLLLTLSSQTLIFDLNLMHLKIFTISKMLVQSSFSQATYIITHSLLEQRYTRCLHYIINNILYVFLTFFFIFRSREC